MDGIVVLVIIFYIIPVLCALISFFRTGLLKTELQLLQLRVRELEAKLAAGSAEKAEQPAENAAHADLSAADPSPAFAFADADTAQVQAAPEQVAQVQAAPEQVVQVQAVPEQVAPEQVAQVQAVPDPAVSEQVAPVQLAMPGVLVTLWRWFRANPILYIGLGVFLTGMAFALNFLTQHGYLTVELRLGAAMLVGVLFLGGGWTVQKRNALVGQALMGGGAVILYLTLFMAARLQVLGMGTVFAGMVALVIGTTLLAVKVDAQLLAVLSTAGGFAVPVLLATESGNHVGLFSYYSLLAAGNLLLLRLRAWDIPGLLSFAAVSVVGGLWAQDAYQPAMFPEMEAFLGIFFLIFSVMQLQLLRHAQEQPGQARRLVHASYLFGLPLAAFGCQYLLTRPYLYADAVSSLGLAAWYLALRRVYRKETDPTVRLACDAFLILGVAFFALSVPLALHAPWITCTWALQGAGLVWLGLRQERRSLQRAGYALQLLGLLDLMQNFEQLQTPVLGGATNGFVIGVLALCLSGLAILRELHVHTASAREHGETTPEQQRTYNAAQIWALGTGWLVIYFQLDVLPFTEAQWLYAGALCTALWAFAGFLAGRRWKLRLWLYPVQGLWLLLLLYLPCVEYWGALCRPAESGGMLGALLWDDYSVFGMLIFPLAHYAMQRAPELWPVRWLRVSLAGLWLLAVFFGVYQWGDLLYPGLTLNPYAAFFWMLLPVAALSAFLPDVLRRLARIPLYAEGSSAVYSTLSCVLTAWLVVAFLRLCGYDGQTTGGYLPVVSWVDATQLLLLAGMTGLYRHLPVWRDMAGLCRHKPVWGDMAGLCRHKPAWRNVAGMGLGFGLFVFCTVAAARTVCAVTGIAYTPDSLLHDPAFRFVLSVLWGGMALGLMLTGSRLLKTPARRVVWFAGAALLVLTMLKLLLLDMADRSTVYRMVSFLSLGLLMLGMGYFCPLPPRSDIAKPQKMK